MLTKQTQATQQTPTKELFVYDVQTGTISTCSFGDGAVPAVPQQHVWDAEHPLLLACELDDSGSRQSKSRGSTAEGLGLEVATMFATPQGMVLQDRSCQHDCQVSVRR